MVTLKDIRKKKWFVVSILLIVMLVLLVVMSLLQNPGQIQQMTTSPQQTEQVQKAQFDNLTEAEKLQLAIAEQSKADQEYAQWKDDVRVDYPWLNKLPLASDKYYVYFDLEKKTFVATLYPSAGDDIEQLKSTVVRDLKEKKQIPAEEFTFEWVVYEKK